MYNVAAVQNNNKVRFQHIFLYNLVDYKLHVQITNNLELDVSCAININMKITPLCFGNSSIICYYSQMLEIQSVICKNNIHMVHINTTSV